MVIMDIEAYSRREEDFAAAERLAVVEHAGIRGTLRKNLSGICGMSSTGGQFMLTMFRIADRTMTRV
jgi:hypothetical protein